MFEMFVDLLHDLWLGELLKVAIFEGKHMLDSIHLRIFLLEVLRLFKTGLPSALVQVLVLLRLVYEGHIVVGVWVDLDLIEHLHELVALSREH